MNTKLQPASIYQPTVRRESILQSFVTMRVNGQLFGASVVLVQDVLRMQRVERIPLAPDHVAGSLNLRGRIVTVIDIRSRLGLPCEDSKNMMHVVVEYHDELFSFMVDSVGDVLTIPIERVEKNPANLEHEWREVASGVCRLENELLVIMDVQSILTF